MSMSLNHNKIKILLSSISINTGIQLFLIKCINTFSTTWKSSKSDKRDWNEDDKKRKKRPYTLEISKQQKSEDQMSPSEKPKSISKSAKKTSPSKDLLKTTDKPKRGKSRTRSPMQNHRKPQQTKKSPPSLLRSPAFSEQYEEDIDQQIKAATSDESSSGICREQSTGQTSPRKMKKVNNSRRKSLSKSPTTSRIRRRSGSNEEKPASLPGSLPRRRSMQQRDTEDIPSTHSSKSRLR